MIIPKISDFLNFYLEFFTSFFFNYLILHIVLYIVLVAMDYKLEIRFIYISINICRVWMEKDNKINISYRVNYFFNKFVYRTSKKN